MIDKAIKLIVCLSIFFVILVCLPGALTVNGMIGMATPNKPTPIPTPGSNGAEIVREMGYLLERINVGEAVGSGADANNANTDAVHRSWVGDIVQELLPLLPLCIVSIPVAAFVIVALAVLWFLRQGRGDTDLVRLTAVMEELESLVLGDNQ